MKEMFIHLNRVESNTNYKEMPFQDTNNTPVNQKYKMSKVNFPYKRIKISYDYAKISKYTENKLLLNDRDKKYSDNFQLPGVLNIPESSRTETNFSNKSKDLQITNDSNKYIQSTMLDNMIILNSDMTYTATNHLDESNSIINPRKNICCNNDFEFISHKIFDNSGIEIRQGGFNLEDKTEFNKGSVSPLFNIKQSHYRDNLHNKYKANFNKFVRRHRYSAVMLGTKHFERKSGEDYLNTMQDLINVQKVRRDIVINDKQYNKRQFFLTPIPTKRKWSGNKFEKDDYNNAERTAVIMRRMEYSSSILNDSPAFKFENVYLQKFCYQRVLKIQRWYRNLLKLRRFLHYIILIQSTYRGMIHRNKKIFKFRGTLYGLFINNLAGLKHSFFNSLISIRNNKQLLCHTLFKVSKRRIIYFLNRIKEDVEKKTRNLVLLLSVIRCYLFRILKKSNFICIFDSYHSVKVKRNLILFDIVKKTNKSSVKRYFFFWVKRFKDRKRIALLVIIVYQRLSRKLFWSRFLINLNNKLRIIKKRNSLMVVNTSIKESMLNYTVNMISLLKQLLLKRNKHVFNLLFLVEKQNQLSLFNLTTIICDLICFKINLYKIHSLSRIFFKVSAIKNKIFKHKIHKILLIIKKNNIKYTNHVKRWFLFWKTLNSNKINSFVLKTKHYYYPRKFKHKLNLSDIVCENKITSGLINLEIMTNSLEKEKFKKFFYKLMLKYMVAIIKLSKK